MRVNQTGSVRVQLAVGTTTQSIEVNANASMNEAATTNLGTTVGGHPSLREHAAVCTSMEFNCGATRVTTHKTQRNSKGFGVGDGD